MCLANSQVRLVINRLEIIIPGSLGKGHLVTKTASSRGDCKVRNKLLADSEIHTSVNSAFIIYITQEE